MMMVIEMMIMKWQFRGIKSTWDETEEGQKEKKKKNVRRAKSDRLCSLLSCSINTRRRESTSWRLRTGGRS